MAIAETSTNVLEANGTFDVAVPVTELRLVDGRIFHIPTSLLDAAPANTAPSPIATALPVTTASSESIVIPIVEEQLEVNKVTVPTATVRLEKTVEAFDAKITEPLARVSWRVDRVALHQLVDSPPPVRVEGVTTIYPIIEEQLVLTKQLVLKEEVRVTREESEYNADQTVTLRREHLTVHREDIN